MSNRVAAIVTIKNRLGLHARPAMQFVDVAVSHQAAVTVRKGDQTVDGKSIMQMMMLAAVKGAELEIIAEGADAQKAIDALSKLVNSAFGEE